MLKDLRYSMAVHESGHALVGLSFGLQIRGMYIDPDDKGSGTNFRHEDFSRLTLDDQVTVTLAGAEAVEIVGCEHMSGQALEDHALVRATLLRRGIDENTAEGNARGKAIRKNARAWAQVILAPRRELITRLAAALSEAGELDKVRHCWLRDRDYLTARDQSSLPGGRARSSISQSCRFIAVGACRLF